MGCYGVFRSCLVSQGVSRRLLVKSICCVLCYLFAAWWAEWVTSRMQSGFVNSLDTSLSLRSTCWHIIIGPIPIRSGPISINPW